MVERQTFPEAVFFLATEANPCKVCGHDLKTRYYVVVKGCIESWTQNRDGKWSARVAWGDCNIVQLAEADLWLTRAEVEAEIKRLFTPTVVWEGDVLASVDGHPAGGHFLNPAPDIVVRRSL